jgi:hypothetical protein
VHEYLRAGKRKLGCATRAPRRRPAIRLALIDPSDLTWRVRPLTFEGFGRRTRGARIHVAAATAAWPRTADVNPCGCRRDQR